MSSFKRDYPYKTAAGQYWPDADVGDVTYYAIDLSHLILQENEEIVEVDWSTSDNSVQVVTSELNNQIAAVKLSFSKPGHFKVTASVSSTDNGRPQNNVINTWVKAV